MVCITYNAHQEHVHQTLGGIMQVVCDTLNEVQGCAEPMQHDHASCTVSWEDHDCQVTLVAAGQT